MTRALVLRILRRQRRLLCALALGVVALQVLVVHVAAALETGPGFAQLFNALPPALRSFAGAQVGELSLQAFVGFGFQHPAVLAMDVSLVVLTATLPAAERESGLADLLLACPVPRARYLAAVAVAVAAGALLLPAVELLGTAAALATVEAEDKPAWTRYAASALGQATLLLACGGVALLFAAGSARRGPAAARAVGLVLTLFVVEAFADLFEPLAAVRWISLFHYFQPVSAALHGPSAAEFAVLLAVAAACTALSFVRFARCDV